MTDDWLPKNKILWLCFDMSNGDALTRRYVWWFDSRREAMNCLREYRKHPYAAKLSKPVKVKLDD